MFLRHRLAIPLLALGTLAGFASGFHSLRCARDRRAAFERHVAQVCVEAARRDAQARPDGPARGWSEPPPF